MKTPREKLEAERDALSAKSEPHRKKRDALRAKIAPLEAQERKLNAQIRKIEHPRLGEIQDALVALDRA